MRKIYYKNRKKNIALSIILKVSHHAHLTIEKSNGTKLIEFEDIYANITISLIKHDEALYSHLRNSQKNRSMVA